jgi:hypothetical protein
MTSESIRYEVPSRRIKGRIAVGNQPTGKFAISFVDGVMRIDNESAPEFWLSVDLGELWDSAIARYEKSQGEMVITGDDESTEIAVPPDRARGRVVMSDSPSGLMSSGFRATIDDGKLRVDSVISPEFWLEVDIHEFCFHVPK